MVISEEAVTPSLDEPETSFLSVEDDMVARVPIIEGGMRTVTFKIFMMKFWGLISVITREILNTGCMLSHHRGQEMEGRHTVTCETIYWDQIMWITWQVIPKGSLSPHITLMNVIGSTFNAT